MTSTDIVRETDIARDLLKTFSDISDEDAITITLASETNLLEVIGAGVERVSLIETLGASIDTLIESLKSRRQRLDMQAERIRTAIGVAMEATSLKKLELPMWAISLAKKPAGLIVTDESAIPSNFFKLPPPPAPKLDKKAVLDALKAGQTVPGATLDNGGSIVKIRRG